MSKFMLVGLFVHLIISINGRGYVVKDKLASQQITDLKAAGYDVGKLNHYTQLKVFLYTWLAMERAEGGLCHSCAEVDAKCANMNAAAANVPSYLQKLMISIAAPFCDKSNDMLCKDGPITCCTGWRKVMSICTQNEWYNGRDGANVKATISEITRITRA